MTTIETMTTPSTKTKPTRLGRFIKTSLAAVLLAATTAGGLASTAGTAEAGDREVFGTLLGAGLGGLLGSQVGGGKGKLAAVAVGTLTGAVIGNNIAGSPAYANDGYVSQRRIYQPSTYPNVRHHEPDVVIHKHVTKRHVYDDPYYEYDRPRKKRVVERIRYLPDGRKVVKKVIHLPNGRTIVRKRVVQREYVSYDDHRYERRAAKKRAYAKGYYKGYEEGYDHGYEDVQDYN